MLRAVLIMLMSLNDHISYSLFVCFGTQRKCVGHCLVAGKESRSDKSTFSMPHVLGCIRFIIINHAFNFNRDIA